jgi:FAD/FMN-containing dehydrogenase
VRHAVDFAPSTALTAVRAEGYGFSGKSTCDSGLVIDLQQMTGVRVDPETRRAYLGRVAARPARPQRGFRARDRPAQCRTQAQPGSRLAAGLGWLGRRFGLACDNVATFDVVTADGHFSGPVTTKTATCSGACAAAAAISAS